MYRAHARVYLCRTTRRFSPLTGLEIGPYGVVGNELSFRLSVRRIQTEIHAPPSNTNNSIHNARQMDAAKKRSV